MQIKQKLKQTGYFLTKWGLPAVVAILAIGFLFDIDLNDDHKYIYENDSIADESYSYHGRAAGGMEPMAMMAESADFAVAPMAKRSIMPIAQANGFVEGAEQKIIKNASLTIEVDDAEEAKATANAEIKALGGALTNSNCYEDYQTKKMSCNLTFKVPAPELENAMMNVSSLGIKKSESSNARDITSQYQDTENQIKNLEIRRQRLRELMEKDADKLSELLQIDRELANVQTQLDNLARTQKGRDTDVAFSTLNLSLTPTADINPIADDEWNIKKVWKQSVNNLIAKSQGVAEKAIELLTLAPLWLPILILLFFIRRRILRKK